jgi:SAM-dependent methyltransferase
MFVDGALQPGGWLEYAAGLYYVQDAASMLALRLLDAQPAETVADVCAAPGGKATAILEITGPGGGFVLANEPIQSRLAPLTLTMARVGYPGYAISSLDPQELGLRLRGQFDAVLVDAPCSGQSLVSRGRQSPSAFSPQQIRHAAARQQRILASAAELVRPGGRLVYSTCTYAEAENEDVAAGFLEQHGGWQEEELPELAAWRSPRNPGGYRLWPHRDRCAGGYAVRLRCPEAAGRTIARQPAAGAARRNSTPQTPWSTPGIGTLRDVCIREAGRQRFAWPASAPSWLQELPATTTGPEAAYQPAREWLPSHALALRRDPGWSPSETVELSDAEAVRLMAGETLRSFGSGWKVACWCRHPLGWLHSLEKRSNNPLPASARMRIGR